MPLPAFVPARSMAALFLPPSAAVPLPMVRIVHGDPDGAAVRTLVPPSEPERVGCVWECGDGSSNGRSIRERPGAVEGRSTALVASDERHVHTMLSAPHSNAVHADEYDVVLDLSRHETRRKLREWLADHERAAQVRELLEKAPEALRQSLTNVLARLLVADDPPGSEGGTGGELGMRPLPGLIMHAGMTSAVTSAVGSAARSLDAPSRALVPARTSAMVVHEAPLVPSLNLATLPAQASHRAGPARGSLMLPALSAKERTELARLGSSRDPRTHGAPRISLGRESSSDGSPADSALLITMRSSHPDHAEIVSVRLRSQ